MQNKLIKKNIDAYKLEYADIITEKTKLYLIVSQTIDFDQIEKNCADEEYIHNSPPSDIEPYDFVYENIFEYDVDQVINFFDVYDSSYDDVCRVNWNIRLIDIETLKDAIIIDVEGETENITIYSESEAEYTTYIEIK